MQEDKVLQLTQAQKIAGNIVAGVYTVACGVVRGNDVISVLFPKDLHFALFGNTFFKYINVGCSTIGANDLRGNTESRIGASICLHSLRSCRIKSTRQGRGAKDEKRLRSGRFL